MCCPVICSLYERLPQNYAAVISSDMWRIIIISADQKITNDKAHQDTDVESKTETVLQRRLRPPDFGATFHWKCVRVKHLKTVKLGTILFFFCEIGRRKEGRKQGRTVLFRCDPWSHSALMWTKNSSISENAASKFKLNVFIKEDKQKEKKKSAFALISRIFIVFHVFY